MHRPSVTQTPLSYQHDPDLTLLAQHARASLWVAASALHADVMTAPKVAPTALCTSCGALARVPTLPGLVFASPRDWQ